MAINNTSNDAPSKALQMLKRVRRLDGAALISGGVLLHDDCPRGSDAKLFSQAVVQLFEGLEEQGEYANDVLIHFDGGEVLLMFRYPVVLCLFFKRGEDFTSIEKGGQQFLNQFKSALGIAKKRPRSNNAASAPQAAAKKENTMIQNTDDSNDEECWEKFRSGVEILFTKVLGSAQASRMLSRELKAMGVSDTGFLKKNQFRPFGQKLTQRIKDKSIRRQIENELINIIEELV